MSINPELDGIVVELDKAIGIILDQVVYERIIPSHMAVPSYIRACAKDCEPYDKLLKILDTAREMRVQEMNRATTSSSTS